MFIHIPGPKPRCSKCGSTDVGRPVGESQYELKCFNCGHGKLAYRSNVSSGEASAIWQAQKQQEPYQDF